MVRLLLRKFAKDVTICESFNPTMVRLLPEIIRLAAAAGAEFQSHNGAIAAIDEAFKLLR